MDLRSDTGENPERDRALVELVRDLTGTTIPLDSDWSEMTRPEAAERIGTSVTILDRLIDKGVLTEPLYDDQIEEYKERVDELRAELQWAFDNADVLREQIINDMVDNAS